MGERRGTDATYVLMRVRENGVQASSGSAKISHQGILLERIVWKRNCQTPSTPVPLPGPQVPPQHFSAWQSSKQSRNLLERCKPQAISSKRGPRLFPLDLPEGVLP